VIRWLLSSPRAHTVANETGEALVNDLHAAYKAWARTMRADPLSPQTFGKRLSELGRQSIKRGGMKRYRGIELAPALKVVAGR
jgi:hypothetical protein